MLKTVGQAHPPAPETSSQHPPRQSPQLLSDVRWRAALVVIPVLLFIFSRPFTMPTDPDYWWHVKTGEYIVTTGTIPRSDPFSYTAAGQPWVTHEWLTEVILFVVAHHVGYLGNAAVFGLVAAATWFLVYRSCRRRGSGELGAAILTLWGSGIGVAVANVRPQALTALFVAVLMLLLTRFKQGDRRSLWLLPPMMVLWVNLHGGYVIGLALLGVMVAGELATRILRLDTVPLRPLVVVSALTVVATLLNPHGIEALRYPFTYVGTSNASMRYVAEWQSPDFHKDWLLVFAAALVLAMIVGVGRRPLGPTESLWIVLLTVMSLQSVRHVALFAVVVMPLLAARLQTEVAAFRYSLAQWRRPLLLLAVWPAFLLLTIRPALVPEHRANLQLGWEPNPATYPSAAVAYLETHDVTGNIFNEYGWGGYLIYELYPERRVFIDGRIDMYGDAFAERYDVLALLREGWRAMLEEYDVHIVVVPKGSPLAVALAEDPAWRQVLVGEVERLFIREQES